MVMCLVRLQTFTVQQGNSDELLHNYHNSLFWLAFHYSVFEIADMFTLVRLMELFYSEASIGLRSLSTSFSWLPFSLGYFLSSVMVEIINSVTSKLAKRNEDGDISKNHCFS